MAEPRLKRHLLSSSPRSLPTETIPSQASYIKQPEDKTSCMSRECVTASCRHFGTLRLDSSIVEKRVGQSNDRHLRTDTARNLLRAQVQVGKPPCQPVHEFEGRKAYLTGLAAVTTVSTIIYGPCRSRLRLAHFSRQVQRRVLLHAWYTQPNHEGTADPLASVLAKSRLMSVVQEFRN
jgi:hypothetical protein